ncbi:MAG: S24/S26 family peptidase [Paludibacteraceae bacterium]|nr:S24/S26 family peptidase [Paludibacteraceae bacterium]
MIIRNDILFASVKEMLKEKPEVKVVVKGDSMLPFLRTGDMVALRKPHSLRIGMIALVEPSDGVYILHRIVKLNDEDMVLYGDGNIGVKEKVPYSAVVAVVQRVYRGKRVINYGSFMWKLQNKLWPGNKIVRKYVLKLYKKSVNQLNKNNQF